jgi:hypothetical protein
MKNFSTLRFRAMAVALSLTASLSFAQSVQETEQPQEEKKRVIKIQCLINGKIAPSNLAFGRKDTEISLKTFPFYEQDRKDKKELVVQEFDVALLRDGKKIANQTVFGSGSIEYLTSMAKNEDTYLIQVKEVFEKTKEGNLKPYAKGVIKLAYLFYDLEMFKPASLGNAISASGVK